MKPRGKNYKRMKGNQKVKFDKTLKRMTKIRTNDNVRLRKNIQDKLTWAKEQKELGLKAIEEFKNRIRINTQELFKLEGIILALSQILSETSNKEK